MTLLREARLAWRGLVQTPGYTAAFVLTLGLGIGANTAIFSVVRGIWLRPLPHTNGDRLVYLRHSARAAGFDNVFFSVPEIEDIRTQASSFEGVVEFSSMTFTMQGLDQPRRVTAGVVTANYFEVMGLGAIEGRLIAGRDDGETVDAVAVLTEEFWRQTFGADPGVVGRVIRMDRLSVEIVGVLEPAPPYPERTDMYVNMAASPHHLGATMTQNRLHRMTEVFARLAPGATVERAAVEVDEISRRLHVEYPAAYDSSQGYRISVTTLRKQLASRAATTVLVLLAVTGLVLIIACANVANLTLARVMRRQGELAIRVSLGASAWRIRRQLLVESLIPSLVGALLGCLIAYASVDLLTTYAARYSAQASEIAVDGVVLSVALLVGVLAAVSFALLPRLPSASSTRPDGARVAGGTSGRRVQRLLVVSQVAVCSILLVGAGLLLRTLYNLQAADGGLDLEDVLTVEMPSPPNRDQPGQRLAYFRTILEKARSLPGVQSAAFAPRVPLREVPGGPAGGLIAMELEFENEPVPPGSPPPRGDFRPVSPDYFGTVGLSLLDGRLFDEADREGSQLVVVINRAMAERYFGGRDAVGHRLAWRGFGVQAMGLDGGWRRIVGVVSDSNDYGMTAAPPLVAYQPARARNVGRRHAARADSEACFGRGPARFDRAGSRARAADRASGPARRGVRRGDRAAAAQRDARRELRTPRSRHLSRGCRGRVGVRREPARERTRYSRGTGSRSPQAGDDDHRRRRFVDCDRAARRWRSRSGRRSARTGIALWCGGNGRAHARRSGSRDDGRGGDRVGRSRLARVEHRSGPGAPRRLAGVVRRAQRSNGFVGESEMTIAPTDKPTLQKPLRLWPGVVLVALQWLGWWAVPIVVPDATFYGILGGLLAGPVLLVWWAFFSRAPRFERWGAVALVIVAMAATPRLLHESVAKGNMGMQFFLWGIPVVSLAFVAWAVASRRLADRPRRAALVATILLACGVFTLVRSKGVTGDGMPEFTWRWTETAEQRLLAQASDESVAIAPSPAAPEMPDEPPPTVDGDDSAALAGPPRAEVSSPAILEDARVASVSTSPAREADAEWPGFRGPDRTGIVPGLRIETDWSTSPPVRAVAPPDRAGRFVLRGRRRSPLYARAAR